MRRTLSAIAVALGAAALTVGAAVAPVWAETPPPSDDSKYIAISGPAGLVTGGDWGVWTLRAKNPNSVADGTDHLVLNAAALPDARQLQLEYRVGSSGAWAPAPVSWHQTSSDPSGLPAYLGSWDVTGKALGLTAHSAKTFQVRARRIPGTHVTEPFPIEFSAFLAPAAGSDGRVGTFVARADAVVAPLGLTTSITGLPSELPADGRPRPFQIHIGALNHADWKLARASFFVWQGQEYGQPFGPASCDAEVDVWDPVHRSWHKVGTGVAGSKDLTVDLTHWAEGPAWDQTVNARITLGAGFRSGPDASIGFGWFPGAGGSGYFWAHQKLTSTPVSGAPACVRPAGTTDTTAARTQLPETGGGSGGGLAVGVALAVLGLLAVPVLNRRARRV